MTDRKKHAQAATEDALDGDREAGLIHDLATAPPPKDMASVKAASDVVEANRNDEMPERRTQRPGLREKTENSTRRAAFADGRASPHR